MSDFDPRNLNLNTGSHTGLGDSPIFQHPATEKRVSVVRQVIPDAVSVMELLNHDQRPAGSGSDEGTYMAYRGNGDSVIVHVKKEMENNHLALCNEVATRLKKYIQEAGLQNVISVSNAITLPSGEYVQKAGQYMKDGSAYTCHAYATEYHEADHIKNPCSEELFALGQALAVMGDGLGSCWENITPEQRSKIEEKSKQFFHRVPEGSAFITANKTRAFDMATKWHGEAGAKTLLSLAQSYVEGLETNAVLSQGWASKANIMRRPDGGILVVDIELLACSLRPPGYDEGVVFSDIYLNNGINLEAKHISQAMDNLLAGYNKYARNPMTRKNLASVSNYGNITAVLFGYSICADGRFEDGMDVIKRHGEKTLNTHALIKAALELKPANEIEPYL